MGGSTRSARSEFVKALEPCSAFPPQSEQATLRALGVRRCAPMLSRCAVPDLCREVRVSSEEHPETSLMYASAFRARAHQAGDGSAPKRIPSPTANRDARRSAED